ncbi:Mitochondrial import receptor subunit TOM34 [Schistosoma japonicum]|nr:Mitochondrial import receptor subunit TOM34 [Schistosoma japonicum]
MFDPEVMKAFSEVCSNPAAMDKYKNNPKVKKVIEKMKNRFGGAGGGMPGKFRISIKFYLDCVNKRDQDLMVIHKIQVRCFLHGLLYSFTSNDVTRRSDISDVHERGMPFGMGGAGFGMPNQSCPDLD